LINEFIDKFIIPYVTILGLSQNEYELSKVYMLGYGLKPSDSFHSATMKNHNIEIIVNEDKEFDKINEIKRIWL
jgi:predicted nucleic acid-binding protein